MKLGMSIAMIAMFVVALVIPEAYVDLPGGLYGPLVLVVAYMVVRVTHLTLYYIAAAQDPPLRRQILRPRWRWSPDRDSSSRVRWPTTPRCRLGLADRAHARRSADLRHVDGRQLAGALRGSLGRAIRPGRDPRAGRVDRRDRRGRGAGTGERGDHHRLGAGDDALDRPLVDLLRYDRTRRGARAVTSSWSRAGRARHRRLHLPPSPAHLGHRARRARCGGGHRARRGRRAARLFGASALYGGVSCYLAGVAFWLRVARNVKWLRFGAAVLFLAGVPIAVLRRSSHSR